MATISFKLHMIINEFNPTLKRLYQSVCDCDPMGFWSNDRITNIWVIYAIITSVGGEGEVV